MARLFRSSFACPIPFRSPLLPLRGVLSGETPRIVCYHAEPLDGGRDMLLTRYAKWLLPEHGIDEVVTRDLGQRSLEATATFMQTQLREAGLSPIADIGHTLQDSWNAAGRALTCDDVPLPTGFGFLAEVPLMIDALAQHDLMPQKHGGLQRIVKGRPVGSGTAETAVIHRVQEMQRSAKSSRKSTGSPDPLLSQTDAKIGSWLYKPNNKDGVQPRTTGPNGHWISEIGAGAGFQGIKLMEKKRWIWEPVQAIPVAVIGHSGIWNDVKRCILTEHDLNDFFDGLAQLDEPNRINKIQNHGNSKSDYWHWLYAKRAFDKLRADAAAKAAPVVSVLPAPAPTRPKLDIPYIRASDDLGLSGPA